ncbi:MAG: precorrin-6Y C5,15-methyltransferase (decarboxylating) subunit CbiT [Methanomicrobiales archaeon]|nr:precorrin-6Y C5,15-methyltransferase (decarboxylating) subunit CbiT [Methanomicrobiales archaeon]
MELTGGPTQDEVMAISLYKLGIRAGDCVADIGCGTGKVAVELAGKAGRVVAIDRRSEAVACTRSRAETSGACNITVMHGEATALLPSIGNLDCAFVGGSGDLEAVLSLLSTRVKRTIVVNAVLLDTVQRAVRAMQDLGMFREVVHVQVARSYPLAGSIALKPINPVYIIVGEVKEVC